MADGDTTVLTYDAKANIVPGVAESWTTSADGLTVTSPRDPERRGGTITIAVDDAAAVTAELVRRGIIVDYRPGAGIRVSPHFYNTEADIDHALATLREVVSSV